MQKWVWLTDVYSVHISKQFTDWFKTTHPDGLLIFVAAGCTGVAQPGDLVVNQVYKSMVKNQSMKWIAQQVAAALTNKEQPQIDVKMSVLKPLLIQWLQQPLDFFGTPDGQKRIISGFQRAKLLKAFDLQFQQQVALMPSARIWSFSDPDQLEPMTQPFDEPSEENIDVIDLDEEEVRFSIVIFRN